MPETSAVNESFLTQHERQTDGHRYVAHFIMAPRWVGIALMTTRVWSETKWNVLRDKDSLASDDPRQPSRIISWTLHLQCIPASQNAFDVLRHLTPTSWILVFAKMCATDSEDCHCEWKFVQMFSFSSWYNSKFVSFRNELSTSDTFQMNFRACTTTTNLHWYELDGKHLR